MKCKRSAWSCPYHACMSDECQRAEVIRNGSNFGVGLCRKIYRKSTFSKYLTENKTLPISFNESEHIERKHIVRQTPYYILKGEKTIQL